MLVPISLVKADRYHARASGMQLVQGLLAGLALALLVYSVAHWPSLRNSMFGLYALMVGGSATFFLSCFGLVQQYLWSDPLALDLGAKLSPLSVLLALTAAGRFIALSLDTRTHNPRLHRGLTALSAVAVRVLVAAVLGLHIEAERRDAERTEVERRTLESLADTDALTGLPNRPGLRQTLEAALADCRAGGERVLAIGPAIGR